ncbi:MAG: hypothetical protein GX057_00030 [Clostridiales bacterium]|nr:hypothetical protein [Clostridiales bacterium]HOA84741.1 hypothetical protein [Bacillota bacterium]
MGYSESRTAERAVGTKKGRVLIMQSSAEVLGSEVVYRLYRAKQAGEYVYLIYAGYKRERVYCAAGKSRDMAESIFSAVVKGRVTPCTLPCIVSDLLPDAAEEEAAVFEMYYKAN